MQVIRKPGGTVVRTNVSGLIFSTELPVVFSSAQESSLYLYYFASGAGHLLIGGEMLADDRTGWADVQA